MLFQLQRKWKYVTTRRLTVTQRGHLPWQIHRGSKRKRTRNPQFLKIMITLQHQNDDGDVTWIKETNLRRRKAKIPGKSKKKKNNQKTKNKQKKKKNVRVHSRCTASWRDVKSHVTNEEVRNRIRQAIEPYEDLLTTVEKPKLRWYGHVTRSTGLAKMILQGTVQGGRRKGRQKKKLEDNVTEWTGLKLGEALRKAENREEWRKSSCPIILGAPTVN